MPIFLEPEVKKVAEKNPDELSENQDENDENNKDEEENKNDEDELEEGETPKFKPEGYYWTSYDGKPRNYIQILKRYNKYPLEDINIDINNLENLFNIISSIIVEKKNVIDLIHVHK
jgi:hypothetical protein